MRITVPTILTLLRIGMIPIFVLCFYLPASWSNIAATVVFGMAAVTDWLDGYLARRLRETSAFGAFLDPVADKLMVATALVLLVDINPTPYPGAFLAIAAAVIIGREITISALREWMAELGANAKVAVSYVGKVKTTAQMVALLLLLYREPIGGISAATVGFWLLYLAAGLTLWSMFLYVRTAWPDLMETSDTQSVSRKS